MQMDRQHIRVPEGYFDDLQARLSAIPSSQHAAVVRPWYSRLAPYAAMAACMAAMVIAGNFILRRTAPSGPAYDEYETMLSSELIPNTDPYAIYHDSDDVYEVSLEDVAEYLIASGTKVDHISFIIDE